MKKGPSRRIWIISICVLLFALLLIGKLYFVQIVHGKSYAEKANRQYTKPSEGLFDRGSIFFSEKDSNLTGAAILQDGFKLVMNPKKIVDASSALQKINAILPLDEESFLAKAAKPDDVYEEIAKKIPTDAGEKIDALQIPGITLYKDKWRLYPAGETAAHVLGFVGSDGQTLAGRYGLERYYDDVLTRAGAKTDVNFFAEIFSNVSQNLIEGKEGEGDIVTTIEPTVESSLEGELKGVEDKWQSESSGGIIMNPQTGEIYAMAATPTFDPNSFQKVKDPSLFSNPLVENVYEMGSIIKPLTMAAGIDTGTVTATTTYTDAGFLELNGKKISNFDGKGRGVIDMQEVLNQSLNTGAAFVALKMGNEKFSQYFKNYGLGEETGIDLPNEAGGLIQNLDSPRDVEHATAAFGQGIALTPIATVRALSALGNGGYLPDPHVVKKIQYTLGYSKEPFSGGEKKQVIKKETSAAITKMLVEIVDKALRYGKVALPHYSVAAKTGTAQISNPGGGGYYTDRYLHSFFGYFPAYDPKFLVFLYTVYPKGAGFASETLTDPFINLTKFLINYYEVPPDR